MRPPTRPSPGDKPETPAAARSRSADPPPLPNNAKAPPPRPPSRRGPRSTHLSRAGGALLAAAGPSNEEIADQLSLSVRTVESRLQDVYEKLGSPGRDQLNETLSKNDRRHPNA